MRGRTRLVVTSLLSPHTELFRDHRGRREWVKGEGWLLQQGGEMRKREREMTMFRWGVPSPSPFPFVPLTEVRGEEEREGERDPPVAAS